MKRILKHSLLVSPMAVLGLFSAPTRALVPLASFASSSAEEIVTEKTIYIDLSLSKTFATEGAFHYISYLDGNETVNVGLELVNNDIYSVSLPLETFDKTGFAFQINCAIPSEEGGSSPTIYTSATIKGDSELKKPNRNYVALDEDSESELGAIEGFGFYAQRTDDPGATYVTQRVWLADANIIESKLPYGEVYAIGYFEKEEWHIIDMTKVVNGNGAVFYYADIPYEAVSVDYLRVANAENHNYCIYSDVEVAPLSYGACYALSENGVSAQQVVGADANLLALVVEAYLTYGDAPSNGSIASTVANLYDTWFAKASADANALKTVKILDYTGYVSNGNSYENLSKKSTFSAYEKWYALCSRAGIDPKTGQSRQINASGISFSKRTLLILGAGVVGFSALLMASVLFVRRRINAR